MTFLNQKQKINLFLGESNLNHLSNHQIEYICEKLKKWDKQKISNIIYWHKKITKKNNVKVKNIPLCKMKNWIIDKNLKKMFT